MSMEDDLMLLESLGRKSRPTMSVIDALSVLRWGLDRFEQLLKEESPEKAKNLTMIEALYDLKEEE